VLRSCASNLDLARGGCDRRVVVAAEGVSSKLRTRHAAEFGTSLTPGRNRFMWLGTTKVFPTFQWHFRSTHAGWIWAWTYPSAERNSTFIVECGPETWSGLGRGTPPNPPRNHGHDHLYREFIDSRRSRQAAVQDREPEDEGQRALYRAGQRGGFIGSPAFIRDNLKRYEDAHLDAMIFVAQCGDRKHADVMESIELFAKEVMPEFQERHEKVQRPWRECQLEGVAHLNNSTI